MISVAKTQLITATAITLTAFVGVHLLIFYHIMITQDLKFGPNGRSFWILKYFGSIYFLFPFENLPRFSRLSPCVFILSHK